MKSNSRSAESAQFFQQDLEHLLDQRQLLYKLANQLPWQELGKAFVLKRQLNFCSALRGV